LELKPPEWGGFKHPRPSVSPLGARSRDRARK
jgi:hypothetical protein